jgi:hypothetical protein
MLLGGWKSCYCLRMSSVTIKLYNLYLCIYVILFQCYLDYLHNKQLLSLALNVTRINI